MRFTAQLRSNGGNAAGFVVPEEVVTGLASGRRPKVVATVGAHSWRSSIASMGGVMMLGMSVADRTAAGVAAGETLDVDVELDTAERVVEVPGPLAAALAADPAAQAFWATLSYSNQRAYAEPVRDAKTEETRERRVAKAVASLREGRKRP